jgi:hypothetical protein
MKDRGATKDEVIKTIEQGEQFPAKFERLGFRRNFLFQGTWRGKHYQTKQVEAYAVREKDDFIVLTVITRYF